MNAVKRFKSKKRLIKKLKDKAREYRMKVFGADSTNEIEKPWHLYKKWAKENEKHARDIENSCTYKWQKDYAKNRRKKGR